MRHAVKDDMSTINLSASAAYGMTGQFVARVTGRHAKYTFEYEFLGRKSGKRGECSSADVDEPGLYVERDVDRKGNKTDSFFVLGVQADGKFVGVPCPKSDAMALAKLLGAGEKVDWPAEVARLDPSVPAASDRAALSAERAGLVARLAEIDALLGAE